MTRQQHFGFVRREAPAAWCKTDWQAVADALQAAGVPQCQRAIEAAKGAGLVPDDVRQLLREYHDNAQRFNGPDAVLYRLANGRWPPTIAALSAAGPAPVRGSHEFEMWRAKIFRALRKAGKSQDEIDAEIKRLLRPPPIVGRRPKQG